MRKSGFCLDAEAHPFGCERLARLPLLGRSVQRTKVAKHLRVVRLGTIELRDLLCRSLPQDQPWVKLRQSCDKDCTGPDGRFDFSSDVLSERTHFLSTVKGINCYIFSPFIIVCQHLKVDYHWSCRRPRRTSEHDQHAVRKGGMPPC